MNKDNITNLPIIHRDQAVQTYDYPVNTPSAVDQDDEIDLRQLWQIFLRRKWLIISIALLVFVLATVITLMMKPVYRASTTLQINPDSGQVLDYDIDAQRTPINTKDFYQTQYELLKSRTLADRVIDELGLEHTFREKELAKPFFIESFDSLKSTIKGFLPNADISNEADQYAENIDDSELRGKKPLADKLLDNLQVQPVKNSQIVTLHYNDNNPERAAIIANTLADNFVEMNLERRRDSATYAEKFLANEIVLARSRLQESEARLNDYARERGIINVNNSNGSSSLTGQRLQNLNKALIEAEKDRIAAESAYRESSAEGASVALKNIALQEMKQSLAKLESQYQSQLSSSASFDDPSIRALKQRLAQLQSEYQAELSSSRAFTNPTIQVMKQRLAQLQTQLRGGRNGTNNAFNNGTMQALKQQKAQLESEYQQKLQIYKPAYPYMLQLKEKINELNQQLAQENQAIYRSLTQQINQLKNEIAQETRALGNNTKANLRQQIEQLKSDINRESQALDANNRERLRQQINELKSQVARESANIQRTVMTDLRSKYEAALQRERTLRSQFNQQKQDFVSLQDKNIGYNNLKREVESSRSIYTSLLDRQKQIGVAGGVGSNNISVVDPAVTPFMIHKPNIKLNLALGAVLGLFIGSVVAFLLEFIDDRVKSVDEVNQLLGLPLLGMIPISKQKSSSKLALMMQTDPRSAFAESFRSLRTNLMFSSDRSTPPVLALTSSAPNEGKSTSSINLATAFAQAGKNVLLVDADLRNPSVHKLLDLDNSSGLTNVLTAQATVESVTQNCQIPDVYVITAGPISPNPVELLSSTHLDQILTLAHDKTFDLVLLDLPPVLGLADALVVSSRVDATVVAATVGESKKQVLVDAVKRLKHARANIIGVVSTKTKQGAAYGYQYSYDYYGYGQKNSLLDAA